MTAAAVPIVHNPADSGCACHLCRENRWREEQEQLLADRLARENSATIARAEREYQLRLPMAPLPHCAGQPRSLARDFVRACRPIQLEL